MNVTPDDYRHHSSNPARRQQFADDLNAVMRAYNIGRVEAARMIGRWQDRHCATLMIGYAAAAAPGAFA